MQKLQLSIPDPCHENWDNMTATNQGRFCNACAKTVIDFSEMSDDAVLAYFSKQKEEKVCGRLYPDQMDRVIQPLPVKTFTWRWNYILAFFLFFKAAPAKAQGRIAKKENCALPVAPPVLGARDSSEVRVILGGMQSTPQQAKKGKVAIQREITVAGKIVDEKGDPIPFASVIAMPARRGMQADKDGQFSIKLNPLKDKLTVSAVGYEARTIAPGSSSSQNITLQLSVTKLGEVVMVTDYRVTTMGMMSRTVPIKRTTLSDSIKKFFWATPAMLVSPNPVQRGSIINIETKLKKGTYRLQVMDATGRLMSTKSFDVTAGKFTAQQQIKATWNAGQYFIKIVNAKGKLVESSAFIVL